MDGGNKHGRAIPTNFGLKYNPPKLGIQYYIKGNPKATFVHEVLIENVSSKQVDELINDLFTKHKKFIDPKVVSRNQLENLMDRLKSHSAKENILKNKENLHENANSKSDSKVGKADNWGLDGDSRSTSLAHNNIAYQNDEISHPAPSLSCPKSVITHPYNKEEETAKPQNFEKDIFSGAHKEEFKNGEKEFMLDDFDMDNEDQKINDGHDMFDGLEDDDLPDKQNKHFDSNNDDDRVSNNMGGDDNDDEDDSDAIDIDNEEELAARGLKKIQIEGEEEEFLMDAEGNIYNLNGDFIGTTNGDAEEDGDGDGDGNEDGDEEDF